MNPYIQKIKAFFYKPLIPWVTKKHRLVVVNDHNLTEEKSWTLSPFRFWSLILGFFSISFVFTIILIRFTFIGYFFLPNANTEQKKLKNEMLALYVELDSLQKELVSNASFVERIKMLTKEEFEYEKDVKLSAENVASETGKAKGLEDIPEKSQETRKLVETVQNEKKLQSLVQSIFVEGNARIDRNQMIAPVSGVISDTFALGRNHLGIDIVAPKGSVIKAVRSGTVILSSWSSDTGHMIGIQHDNNLITWYKHNSARLKNTGDRVESGEAIAIIGNSGEMSSGPHLHFELWYAGQPVNPKNYIEF
jgi:murein DD-endopeptidase MepM/ murein hydrolase activator NlpD